MKMNKIYEGKKIEQIYCHSKLEAVEKSFSIRVQMERFVNKYFIYYCLLSMKDGARRTQAQRIRDQRQNNAKNGEQNERY